MGNILRTIFAIRSASKRKEEQRANMASGASVGSVRAGMHQKSEHEFQRSRMAEAADPVPETAEDALDMPAALEAEIPPVEEEDDEITADIAEGEAAVETDEEILEDVAEPQAEIIEEETDPEEVSLAVDYSAERIPVLDPVLGGGSDPDTPLAYDRGDGSLKEIQEPLPGMEKMGVEPYIPGADEVISAPSTDVEFEIDSDGDLVVS